MIELDRIEWMKAQELLLKLVRTLTPLTDEGPLSVIIDKSFFRFPTNTEGFFHIHHPVCLLTTLTSVQQQVEEWIQAGPSQAEVNRAEERQKEPPIPPSIQEERISPKDQPISIQAKRLIHQVQEAIGKLCHSTNIQTPNREPVREALRQIKPKLDQIIEVAHEESLSPLKKSSSAPFFRYPVFPSTREAQLKKRLFSSSQHEEQKAAASSAVKKVQRVDSKETSTPSLKALMRKEKMETEKEAIKSISPLVSADGESQSPAPHTVEKTVLPAAPFIPLSKNFTFERKRKKRKGLWSSDEEEKQDKS